MDKKTIVDRLVGPLAFLVIYSCSLAYFFHPVFKAEIAGDFSGEEPEFRVLGVQQGAQPHYVSYTLAQLGTARRAPANVSFLLPASNIDLKGGR